MCMAAWQTGVDLHILVHNSLAWHHTMYCFLVHQAQDVKFIRYSIRDCPKGPCLLGNETNERYVLMCGHYQGCQLAEVVTA